MAMRIGGAIRSHGVAVSRCRVVLAGKSVFAVWRSLGRMEVVWRGTDECRRSTGPSTHHQVSAVNTQQVLALSRVCGRCWLGDGLGVWLVFA